MFSDIFNILLYEVTVQHFGHFSTEVSAFLLVICKNSCFAQDMSPLPGIYIANVFLQLCSFMFTLLMVSFKEQMFLILVQFINISNHNVHVLCLALNVSAYPKVMKLSSCVFF